MRDACRSARVLLDTFGGEVSAEKPTTLIDFRLVTKPPFPPVPTYDRSTVVIEAPGEGPGNWAGAPSALFVDGTFWLAYRVRRPLDAGRGVAVVIARSADGIAFESVAFIPRERSGAESLERPALVARPDGGFRLYLSCATPGSKHWWIEAWDADTPELLPEGRRTVVLPGDPATAAYKDPVVQVGDEDQPWRMWVCRHPLDVAGHEDRMTTWLATSPDGLAWTPEQEVLAGRAGAWDARGARVVAVLDTAPSMVLYDGRERAEQNWFERTGVAALGADGRLEPVGDGPVSQSPESDGALRYTAAVALPGGDVRFYYEAARADGAHDLRTELVRVAAGELRASA
jgi:hypothetical protein